MAAEMTKVEMQAQLDAMRTELAAKNEELAKAKEAAEQAAANTPSAQTAAPVEGNPNRRVKIQLFKDNDRYKEALYVSVNDYRAAIPRGVPWEVPYFVAEHIRETQEQDASTAAMVQMLSGEYEQRSKIMG